jgi:hypothetical protein
MNGYIRFTFLNSTTMTMITIITIHYDYVPSMRNKTLKLPVIEEKPSKEKTKFRNRQSRTSTQDTRVVAVARFQASNQFCRAVPTTLLYCAYTLSRSIRTSHLTADATEQLLFTSRQMWQPSNLMMKAMFLRNFGNHLQDYMVSQPTRSESKSRKHKLPYV